MQHSTGKSSPSPHQWAEWWPLKRYVHGLVPEREVAQSCPTLCDPVDCSLPGFSIHGIFQAGVLEWVAISFESYLIWRKGLCTCSWGKDLEVKRHPRLFWKTLNPVTSILVRHMREKRRQTQRREQLEERDRDWSDAATSQGSWEIRMAPGARGGRGAFCPSTSRGGEALPLLECGLQGCHAVKD